MTTQDKTDNRKCCKCGKFTLPDQMASLDFAAEFNEKCRECGSRNYFYVGAHDGKSAWVRFEAAFPKESAR